MTSAVQPVDSARTALLVMDFEPFILGNLPDKGDAVVSAAQRALAAARAAGATIGYVRVAFADGEKPGGAMAKRVGGVVPPALHADAPTTQVDARLAPQDGDIAVRKNRPGAFSTTDLHEQLQQRGIDTLFLAGVSTSNVVLSTTRAALDLDYRVIVVTDACADRDPELHETLVTTVYPKQVEVIESGELAGLLQ